MSQTSLLEPPPSRRAGERSAGAGVSPVERYAMNLADARAIYDAFRRQIEHEDNLMTSRASWLFMAQSFFVVAYSILHQLAPPDSATQPVTALLTHALAIVGLLACLPILMSVMAASNVMRNLRDAFDQKCRVEPALARLTTDYPALQPTGRSLLLGRCPAVALPVLFLAFWATMLIATVL